MLSHLIDDRLHSKSRHFQPLERQHLLKETTLIAKAMVEPSTLCALAIRRMASLSVLMGEKEEITRSEALKESKFLMAMAGDETSALLLRSSAIKAVDLL